jgi:hypothetical protein
MGKNDEKVCAPEEGVTDLERVVTAPQQPCEKDEELMVVETAASQKLPFSKARCVALVAAIAAAPFLSVGTSGHPHERTIADVADRRWPFKLRLSYYRPSAKILISQSVASNGSFRPITSHSDASWYVPTLTTERLFSLYSM